MTDSLVEIRDLTKQFLLGRQTLRAVDGISLDIHRGETFGLVGESGCGKTTTGRVLVRLHKPSSGQVRFAGEDIFAAENGKSGDFNRKVQMIFQDPRASLNPRMVVSDIIAEGIDIHGLARDKDDRLNRVHELLRTVGLRPDHAGRYPHEFSGGQRQRIGIARALAVEPEFIVADEPLSALDVSIQAQIINLLRQIQRERELTFLFISHDLSVVRYISDRIGVMYLGQLVEVGDADEIYHNPRHPYTRALLTAAPKPDPDTQQARLELSGDVPDPLHPPQGCRFRPRCPYASDNCGTEEPEWRDLGSRHWVYACHCVDSPTGEQADRHAGTGVHLDA